MSVCKKICVSGRVQGVFFRAFTQRQAQDLGISGWTSNQEDGSVLVMACGEENQMNEFIKALQMGPTAAIVEKVAVETIEDQTFADFVIRR